MSQPKMTSQKLKPECAAERNLSVLTYLPRSVQSMSNAPSFTRRISCFSRRSLSSAAFIRALPRTILRWCTDGARRPSHLWYPARRNDSRGWFWRSQRHSWLKLSHGSFAVAPLRPFVFVPRHCGVEHGEPDQQARQRFARELVGRHHQYKRDENRERNRDDVHRRSIPTHCPHRGFRPVGSRVARAQPQYARVVFRR